ncbi:class I SAM-dependent methyltransferase [Lacrimispora sp. 38-1]|uniref:class I SAM-dependent methyltransferase n=1 Tax=Lacrimispora sp. 38-1 TaxID=3125778 RepID=UPI003CF1C77A
MIQVNVKSFNEKIKEEVTDYWTSRAEIFNELKIQELNSDMRGRWLEELQKYLPARKGLKILDIGTGTGFFCFLLAAEGHDLTGIDLTEKMILEARKTSKILGIPAAFYVMDAEKPEFADNSFDAIVTRNVAWTLPDLRKAYEKWHRLLKKDGVLINFDGDYSREDEQQKLPENHAHAKITQEQWNAYEHLKTELRPVSNPRPAWDVQLLKSAGFKDVMLDEQVGERIYSEINQFYNPTPIFTIAAKK